MSISGLEELLPNREGIASITPDNVGAKVTYGRSEDGRPIVGKRPALQTVKMINIDGVEVSIAIQCHRVRTRASWEKYGRFHLEEMIELGFLPKDFCPRTNRWAHLTGGPLVPGNDAECEITPEMTERSDWHGCKHYQKAKATRRARAKEAIERNKSETPTDAMLELAKSMKALAGAGEVDKAISKAKAQKRK